MAIKSSSGPKCMKHQIECTFNCGWCGKPICEECVDVANGKKYCDKCHVKKQQMSPSQSKVEEAAPRVRTPVKNVDVSLDPKVAEQQRITLPNKKQVDPKIFEL